MTQVHIEEHVVAGKRLGRHVNHDPRSKDYAAPEGVVVDVLWKREINVLDQGSLGSCTGNAAVGAVGTDPLYPALTGTSHPTLDEAFAVEVYSQATRLDSAPGSYPPDDTGSDGLSVAKVMKSLGYISGYTHALSLNAALAALGRGPVITGVNWYEGFDSPDASGLVKVSGQVRGGHEFEVVGVDASLQRVRAVNSWGASWGDNGFFVFSFADWDRLLGEQGDVTVLVPLTSPAPTPTPSDPSAALWAANRAWRQARHVGSNAAAVRAERAWGAAMGYPPD